MSSLHGSVLVVAIGALAVGVGLTLVLATDRLCPPIPSRDQPTSHVGWHHPGDHPIRATRVILRGPVAAAPAPVGEGDPVVHAALEDADRLLAGMDAARLQAVDQVAVGEERETLLDSDVEASAQVQAFRSAPTWLLRVAVAAAHESAQERERFVLGPDGQETLHAALADAMTRDGE